MPDHGAAGLAARGSYDGGPPRHAWFMTPDQIIIFCILGALLVMFIWGVWRYDVVAFAGLVAAMALGVVPVEKAFLGFGHPAVVTVAAVLIVSKALSDSGAVDYLARLIEPFTGSAITHIAALSLLAGVLSGFMNNVGALALLMPMAMQSAQKVKRPVAMILMPLSFASILGGLTTLIGTPPNIIVATYRSEALGKSFGMFDFTPVGGLTAAIGIVFLVFIGWRLIPKARQSSSAAEDLFEVGDYLTEAKIPKGSDAVGMTVDEMEKAIEDEPPMIVGIIRKKRRIFARAQQETVKAGDILIVESSSDAIKKLLEKFGLDLVGDKPIREDLSSGDTALVEAVVQSGSRLEGRTSNSIRLRNRYGINLIAVSRQGKRIEGRLLDEKLRAGDILLVQGDVDQLPDTFSTLALLPLAGRDLTLRRSRRDALVAVGIFGTAIGVAALGLASLQLTLAAALVGFVVFNVLPVRRIYDAVDWPVIVLLGAMIPIGGALDASGGTKLIADTISQASTDPVVLIVLILVATMTLSDIMNNAATAVVMAPIAANLAIQNGWNPDAFLMAVAVGASCAFLTPIGHQNNMLVMGPGGYRFGDYWRVGLPLEILIVAVSVPMILWVWPLTP